MEATGRPRPTIGPDSQPFWDACRGHRIALPFCGECGRAHLPAGPVCPYCLSRGIAWRPVSGRGRIATYTVVRRVFLDAFRDEVPFSVAQVELEEGPRLTARLVGLDGAAPAVGMAVEVVFDDVDETLTIPLFRPLPPSARRAAAG